MIARQGADEKSQLEEWKTELLHGLTKEIAQIHNAHNIAMEGQREEMERQRDQFQFEIGALRERIVYLEREKEGSIYGRMRRSVSVQKTPKPAPKVADPALGKELAQSNHANTTPQRSSNASNSVTIPSSPPYQPRQNQPSTSQKSYAQVVKQRPASSSEKPWTEVKYTNRKESSAKKTQRQEPGGRRILFPRVQAQPKKSEEDIMLVLNEALQKAGQPISIRFIRVSYSQSGAISALLTEKADVVEFLKMRTNVLIRAAKTVDGAVIGAEALEHWQRFKVHGMPLARYLGEGKMELLKREVESLTGIKLKTAPRWLIHKNRLRESLESGNNRGSAIVITVVNASEASYLCAKGLRFGGGLKVVENFWEAGPGSVCPICCRIGHDRLGNCGQRPPQCTLCAGPHKLDEHRCGVSGCQSRFGKICSHVTATCANCQGNHQATSFKCPAKHKAERKARKAKGNKEKETAEQLVYQEIENEGPVQEPDEENLDLVMENDDWAASPASSFSLDENNKNPDSANSWD